jgi:hypothetical protein
MNNKLQLQCKIDRSNGGLEFSAISLLPAEMSSLDGKSIKIGDETIRFKMWQGKRLYVNQRRWTLGYFENVEYNLSWGNPLVSVLTGDKPSPLVAEAIKALLKIDTYRIVEM